MRYAPGPLLIFGTALCALAFATDQPVILAALAVGVIALHLAASHRRRMYLVVGAAIGLGVLLLNPFVQANGDLILFELPDIPIFDLQVTLEEVIAGAALGLRSFIVTVDNRGDPGARRPRPPARTRQPPAPALRADRIDRRPHAPHPRARRTGPVRDSTAARRVTAFGPVAHPRPDRRSACGATCRLGPGAVARRRRSDGRPGIRGRAAHPHDRGSTDTRSIGSS